MKKHLANFATIAPYVVWMILMACLPATAKGYAERSLATLAFLGAGLSLCSWRATEIFLAPGSRWNEAIWGVAVGLAVWVMWVLPEGFEPYRRFFILGDAAPGGPSPYDPAVCGWLLTIARLLGSALVIPVAEELFFRKWLYAWLGGGSVPWTRPAAAPRIEPFAFFWMVALFALEHDRWLVGALAGAIYGLLALRRGLLSAIAAHSATNLALGLQVIFTGAWGFW